MFHVPRSVTLRILYLACAAAAVIVAAGVALQVRRNHLYDRLILDAGRRHGVDPVLIASVIWQESRFDPEAYGEAGEVGLMQVTPGAAADWARAHRISAPGGDALWHPSTNLLVGSWYLGRAIRHWEAQGAGEPLPAALAEYNAGRENAARWSREAEETGAPFLDAVTYPGTHDYIEQVLARYRSGF